LKKIASLSVFAVALMFSSVACREPLFKVIAPDGMRPIGFNVAYKHLTDGVESHLFLFSFSEPNIKLVTAAIVYADADGKIMDERCVKPGISALITVETGHTGSLMFPATKVTERIYFIAQRVGNLRVADA
jgi:hypothetical protein